MLIWLPIAAVAAVLAVLHNNAGLCEDVKLRIGSDSTATTMIAVAMALRMKLLWIMDPLVGND